MTATPRDAKTADELAGAVRNHADASVKEAETLAAATLDHTRELVTVISKSAIDTAQRSGQIAADAWKAWSTAALRPGTPALGWLDTREVVNAGFDLATGILDAQRQVAQRLVGAVSAATPGA